MINGCCAPFSCKFNRDALEVRAARLPRIPPPQGSCRPTFPAVVLLFASAGDLDTRRRRDATEFAPALSDMHIYACAAVDVGRGTSRWPKNWQDSALDARPIDL